MLLAGSMQSDATAVPIEEKAAAEAVVWAEACLLRVHRPGKARL